MELDVSRGFVHPATPFPFEARLTLEAQDVGGEAVTFDAVRLEGRLTTTAHAACAVCLAPAEKAIEIDFDETFRKDANETEDECFRYEGKSVPLDHMALTLVMLSLPMRFVCGSADCHAATELKAWNEAGKVWNEEPEDEGTYRPFEGLDELLDSQKQMH